MSDEIYALFAKLLLSIPVEPEVIDDQCEDLSAKLEVVPNDSEVS